MHPARLIPVSGISNVIEAEQRATSALLAVLTIVRDLSIELFAPLGASRAQKATVEAFTEVVYEHNKKKIRPDGLIRISFGKKTWTALVEVKTGDNTLEADQINEYWDLARSNGIDHIVTISNEIAPNDNSHPTAGLKVRSNSKVSVSHLSWTAILTTAVRLKQHAGVSDPEQAWILDELIRYLEHPSSGALAFEDMGPNWVGIRDAARQGDLSKRSDGIEDVATRWDQLLRFAALRLGSEIGDDVVHLLSRDQRDPRERLAYLIDRLSRHGVLDGVLRIPNTVGDLEVFADLRAQHLTAAVDVPAPQDKGAVGRVSWLVNQLKHSPSDLAIESYPKNARAPTVAKLGELLEDRSAILGDDKKEAHKFRVVAHANMGQGRKTGTRSPAFITTVLDLINSFYGDVIQNITPWQPPAPKLKRAAAVEVEREEIVGVEVERDDRVIAT